MLRLYAMLCLIDVLRLCLCTGRTGRIEHNRPGDSEFSGKLFLYTAEQWDQGLMKRMEDGNIDCSARLALAEHVGEQGQSLN